MNPVMPNFDSSKGHFVRGLRSLLECEPHRDFENTLYSAQNAFKRKAPAFGYCMNHHLVQEILLEFNVTAPIIIHTIVLGFTDYHSSRSAYPRTEVCVISDIQTKKFLTRSKNDRHSKFAKWSNWVSLSQAEPSVVEIIRRERKCNKQIYFRNVLVNSVSEMNLYY